MKTTGEQIKSIRLELGETLEEFGKRFNPPVHKGLVSLWENGRNIPHPKNLKTIAEIGGTTVDELVFTNLIGKRIKRIREELGISMSDFALLIDDKAKSGTVANWETGKNLPNRKRLNRIAELGNTTVNQLLNSNPLSDYSTDELLQELERRGISHETTDK